MSEKKISKRIKSRKGETVAETLVAILIAAFALVALQVATATGSDVLSTSDETIQEFYDEASAASATLSKKSAAGEDINVLENGTGSVTYTISDLSATYSTAKSGFKVCQTDKYGITLFFK